MEAGHPDAPPTMPGTSTERTPLLTPKPQPGSSGTITTATSQSPPNLNGGVQDGDGSKRSTAPDTKDDPANLPTARVWAILAANWVSGQKGEKSQPMMISEARVSYCRINAPTPADLHPGDFPSPKVRRLPRCSRQ